MQKSARNGMAFMQADDLLMPASHLLQEDRMTQAAPRDTGGAPVLPYMMSPGPKPALGFFERNDQFQAQTRPALWTEEAQGYWVFTDHEVILDGLNQPDLFSNSVIVPVEPDPPYKWIPIMLDPPEHTKWRQLLGGYFSPKRVKDMKADQYRFAGDLIEKFQTRGEVEFMSEFAQVFPTTIFLQIMGMPEDKLDEFMEWEHAILHGTEETDPDRSKRTQAMMDVMGYFGGLIAERKAHPDLDANDIVTDALKWRIDGEEPKPEDLLSCFLLLFMAGLDTVAAQSSYMIRHLATHPVDRKRIVGTRRSSRTPSRRCCAPTRSCRPPARPPGMPTSTAARSRPATWRRSRCRWPAATTKPSRTRRRSTSTGRTSRTFPSAPAPHRSLGPTSRGRSWSCSWRSGTSASPSTSWPRSPSSTPVVSSASTR